MASEGPATSATCNGRRKNGAQSYGFTHPTSDAEQADTSYLFVASLESRRFADGVDPDMMSTASKPWTVRSRFADA